MKTARAWQFCLRELPIMAGLRQRPHLKRPVWVIVMVSMVCIFLIAAYMYPLRSSAAAACNFFSSRDCTMYIDVPFAPSRELTDDEIYSQVVAKEILKTPSIPSINPKIAFLFLTLSTLPFERLWDKFFQGHEERFSVYVHASGEKPVHVSRYFVGRDIRSDKVIWGRISMVDAERRLLANALRDPDNQHFVLLSDRLLGLLDYFTLCFMELHLILRVMLTWVALILSYVFLSRRSCVPLHNFDYVYHYLMFTNVSFIDCFVDPGPHGSGRYSEHMLPEVEIQYFRKGSQWFTLKRQHAILVMADSLYYTKFSLYCKPSMEHGKNCYADEHYLPTFFQMIDPGGIANWSVTHVDWSEGKWHPKSYRAQDVTYELLKKLASIDENFHVTSDDKKTVMLKPCMWNGQRRPCYLFARKFFPEASEKLMHLFSNYTLV